jgi:lysophospholipase L1-like esterase
MTLPKIPIGVGFPLYKGVEYINQMIEEVNGFQKQIDQMVIEGDSSVEAAQARVDADGNAFTTLKERLDNSDDILSEKATRSELNNLGQLKLDGIYTTLSELQTAYPSGATGLHLVTADGYTYRWDDSSWARATLFQSSGIAAESITPNELAKNEYQPNLFLETTTKNGFYLNDTGVETTLASYCISDFIQVKSGLTYNYYAVDNNDVATTYAGGFYDVNKNWVEKLPGGPTPMPRTWVAPTDGFVRINTGINKKSVTYWKPSNPLKLGLEWLQVKSDNYENGSVTIAKLDEEVITAINDGTTISKWNGKIANFLGDSITYGYGLTSVETERFSTLVGNELGLATVNNYGVSGTKIAKVGTETTNFTSRYSSMANDADIVFVFGGTNDYGHTVANADGTAPFGSFTDRTASTFYGALHVLYSGLINKYLGKKIVVITPTHRIALSGLTGDDYVANPDTNKNLKDYVNAEREVAEYYGIPVLDLFKSFPFNPNITSVRDAYFPDGLHPNAAGHRFLADNIISFMQGL